MKHFFFSLFLFFFLLSANAQTPSFPTSGDIYLGLKKLNVLGSVLYIAAHPDDENTRLLTYLSKDKLYRTGYLSLTRGDGGQNLIGEEQGIELGLIRTQELLAARRIDGAEQFFSRAYDFGYSKSPQETFTKWDREKILGDAVWVIRNFQPDVMIMRFPTTGEGGHGHHTASAMVAVEAFKAAADPMRFPEQLAYVKPWQAKRLLWNTFSFGGNNTTGSDQFKIDVGGFNPVLGKSYGEIAAESRSQHKSQGFGVPRSRGEVTEFFRTIDGEAPSADLLDGVTPTWSRIKGGEAIEREVANALASFDFMQPQKVVPALLKVYKAIAALPAGDVWAAQKLKEVKTIMIAAGGLWMEAFTNVPTVAQGDSLAINVVLNNRLGVPIKLQKISGGTRPDEMTQTFDTVLFKNRNFAFFKKIRLADAAAITQPYWLEEKMSEGYFNLKDWRMVGQPDAQPAATVTVDLLVDGVPVSFGGIPVRYKFSDQVKGELYWPLAIFPSYTLKVEPAITIKQINPVQEIYTAYLDSIKIIKGRLTLRKGVQRVLVRNSVHSDPHYILDPTNPNKIPKQSDSLFIELYRDEKSKRILYDAVQIKYDHIPAITYFKPAVHELREFDLKIAGKKIGYIVGAGDKVPQALEQMGYEVTMLTEKELERTDLKQFDAVIAGVRAFNANDYMGKYYDKLMKYVQDGGNYIVQYSQSNNIKAKIGPYPFNVANRRITDENAAVTFLKPDHPVLNFPNKITQDDFLGWIQERSIYHADNWAAEYEPILSMADPGEAPHNGSLIVGKYGKGFFTYTGLVFFRELPAGVPGAYRLLANLIALNKIKGS